MKQMIRRHVSDCAETEYIGALLCTEQLALGVRFTFGFLRCGNFL
jgi:hypothetical protein